ncbi:hypothetical protein M1N15_01960 [Dehalococcoidia bacterium]|nr:hypothetical protein [Dehalococcoidia bacterium]
MRTVEDVAFHVSQAKLLLQSADHQIRLKIIAREDIYVYVGKFGENMDTYVTLGKEDKSRNTLFLGIQTLVLGHLGSGDLSHPDLSGVGIEEVINEFRVSHLFGIAAIPVNY